MKKILPVLCFAVFPLLGLGQRSGRVVDVSGNPVEGATIRVVNGSLTVTTDTAGYYLLPSFSKNHQLLVSAVGYASRFFSVTAENGVIVMQPEAVQLDEVLVSAEKKEASVFTVPAAVSALGSRQVERLQLRNLRDLTAIVPNLYCANPGDNRNVTSIRGIVSTGYDPAVTTYVDGVNQFNLDTYIPELVDVERIEILRGPQGSLYGRNAMGGVIHVITKTPTDRFIGFARAEAAGRGWVRLFAGGGGPVRDQRMRLRVALSHAQLNGYYDNIFYQNHYDDQHKTTVHATAERDLNERWSLVWNSKLQVHRNDGAFPLVMGRDAAFSEPFQLNQNAAARMVDDIFNHSLRVAHTGKTLRFSSQTAFQSNYRYYRKDLDADFSPLDALSIFNNYGHDWNRVRAVTHEMKLNSDPDRNGLHWSAGTYLFYQHVPVRQSTVFGDDAPMLGIPDSLFSIENISTGRGRGIALYAHTEYPFAQNWRLTAALRFDHESKRLQVASNYHKDGYSFPLLPDTSAQARFNALTPRLGLSVRLKEKGIVFANYSRGFRAGGLTQLSADPSQAPLYAYRPEFSDNIEAGTKLNFGRRVHVFVTVFYSRITDAQIPVLILPQAITVTRNAGKLRSRGIETEIAGRWIKGLTMQHNLGYTHARYDAAKAFQGGQEIELKGKKQVFTPELTSFLSFRYERGLGKREKTILEFNAQWLFVGEQYFDLANAIGQEAYHLLHASAGLQLKQLRVFIWGKNLGDTRYIDYAYDFGAVHLANPRMIGVGISFRTY